MEQQREKDGVDVAIDFFLGAIVGVLVGSGLYFALRAFVPLPSHAYWICLFVGVTLSGSSSALFRHRVMKKPKTGLLLAPVPEALSTGSKVVLWIILLLGCASLVALRFV